MNTNTNTTTTNDSDTTSTAVASRRSHSNLRRAVAVVALAVLAIGSLIGVDAFSARKASAATSITFCSKYAGSRTAATHLPVQLWRVNNAGQRIGSQLRGGKTNASGCATYANTPANVKLAVFANATYGDSNIGWVFYSGATPYYALEGQGQVSVGTGWVYRQCVAGFYQNLCASMPG